MGKITLVTGGIKSGKSRYALDLAKSYDGRKAFIATAEAFDGEMSEKIRRHQSERGADFHTVEEPLQLASAVQAAQQNYSVVLVDCLTLWVNNLLYRFPQDLVPLQQEVEALLVSLREIRTDLILVTNEAGLGVVPGDALSRCYLEELGHVNRRVAAIADEVVLMISGIPSKIKGANLARLEL